MYCIGYFFLLKYCTCNNKPDVTSQFELQSFNSKLIFIINRPLEEENKQNVFKLNVNLGCSQLTQLLPLCWSLASEVIHLPYFNVISLKVNVISDPDSRICPAITSFPLLDFPCPIVKLRHILMIYQRKVPSTSKIVSSTILVFQDFVSFFPEQHGCHQLGMYFGFLTLTWGVKAVLDIV